MNEIHKFLAGLSLVESTAEVTRCGDAVLFLYTTHLHAHMACLDNNHHTQGLQGLLDALFDLQRHTLLHLQAMAVDIDYAGYLGESGDVTVGDVCHVYLAVEGQHVVFTKREEINVFDDDHLAGHPCRSLV